MKRKAATAFACLVTCAPALAAPDPVPPPSPVAIRISDVALFYQLYDAAHGRPSAQTLQDAYLDAGTDGLREFIPDRIRSADALAQKVADEPAIYEKARSCMGALPTVRTRLEGAFRRLRALDPQATFPPVTVVVGRNNSGGTTGPSGVIIGLEVACGADWMQSDPADRLYHLIAHEYGHVEQPPSVNEESTDTNVLKQSLAEGVAELVAALISGEVSNAHLEQWTKGREEAIGHAFIADAHKSDLSDWLYNGQGTPEHPGDLGYWAGYHIARAYYDKAADKRRALRILLDLKDPDAILRDSGWPAATQTARP
ncbi:DUF2268 domain-containing protein [Novosphingobium sp. 1949]|uniref:DUF2268 domain-containing protein n=1 Tax=Novosphingobium organovorum TaxID=2930092 RepID=A0ABT0BBB7_9SPHN|nr:DUF2268 domain-containing putative Zn-dependent protease [Novosphingobium organovorum]MCJ2182351.1 DUF2268 domain-containing protein [Novosphingobium organovorum]